MPEAVVATLVDLRAAWPDLSGTAVIGLALRGEPLDWGAARLDGAVVAGCRFPAGVADDLAARGVPVFPELDALPCEAYRAELYTYDELAAFDDTGQTLDARLGAWFGSSSTSVRDALVRAVHDATVEAAVARFVLDRRVVGVMGGHAL